MDRLALEEEVGEGDWVGSVETQETLNLAELAGMGESK